MNQLKRRVAKGKTKVMLGVGAVLFAVPALAWAGGKMVAGCFGFPCC